MVAVQPPGFSRLLAQAGSISSQATITGPSSATQFVPIGQALPYTVGFTNAPTASAVAEVQVVTVLDADVDPRTFRLGDLELGDIQVHIPSERGTFQGDAVKLTR